MVTERIKLRNAADLINSKLRCYFDEGNLKAIDVLL